MDTKDKTSILVANTDIQHVMNGGGIVWQGKKLIKPAFSFTLKSIGGNPNFIEKDGNYHLSNEYDNKYVIFTFNYTAKDNVFLKKDVAGTIFSISLGGIDNKCLTMIPSEYTATLGKECFMVIRNASYSTEDKNYVFIFDTKEELVNASEVLIESLNSLY